MLRNKNMLLDVYKQLGLLFISSVSIRTWHNSTLTK